MAEIDTILTKLVSDVHIKMSIQNLPLGKTVADVVIPVAKDGVERTSLKLYYDSEDVATDFGADSSVYAKVDTMFSQKDFQGPVAIITTPVGEVDTQVDGQTSPKNVTVMPTNDGGEVATGAASTVKVPGQLKGIIDYLWAGSRYVVLPDDDDTDLITAIGKYLYDNQHMILVASVKSIDNLKLIHDAATAWVAKDHLGNTAVFVNQNEDQYPDAAAAAFASLHIPLDWMHIRDLVGIDPNDWSADEYQEILDLNGLTTVNKSGNVMVSNSKAVDGSYIDNTFGAQYVNDSLQTGLQRFLNSQDLLSYDDKGIKLLQANAESIMAEIAKTGVIANGIDGKPIYKVTTIDRTNTPNVNVVKRKYTGLSITCQLVGSIETVYLTVQVTL